MIEKLTLKAIEYFGNDARRIQHFIKVHSFCRLIGISEGLSGEELTLLEAAAVLHDIGIKNSELKYNSSAGNYQELEGPPVAREILAGMGCEAAFIDRVCYLIGHHHTYKNIDGMDYRILVEADFLVNAYEDSMSSEQCRTVYEKIFKTDTGKRLLETIFM